MMTLSLDVGCGSKKKGYIGVDIRKNSDADIIADACHLPFRNCSFDSVKSFNLLEHCPNPFFFLKEQVRVLKEGGTIICVTDNARYLKFHFPIQCHVRRFKTINAKEYHIPLFETVKDKKYFTVFWDALADHYMIFYPENVVRMLHLLHLTNIRWRYLKSKSKLDLIMRVFPFFRENSFAKFEVKAVKNYVLVKEEIT